MSIHTNFRAKTFQKPLFRFVPRLSILPELDLSDAEKKLVLDPIGNQPFVISDLINRGASVVSSPVNPVERLILDCIFDPPVADMPLALLNKFFDVRHAEQRLEQHLRGLFQTDCDFCGKEVYARYFIRDGASGELKKRSYRCSCGASGSFVATERDQQIDADWRRSDGLYRSRVARTFIGVKDITKEDVLEVLSIYSPRALYALDLINQKLSPLIDRKSDKYFRLMLLYIADSVSGLWNLKDQTEPPKLIFKPKEAIEFNIWAAIEDAVEVLQDLSAEKEDLNRNSGSIKFINLGELRTGDKTVNSVVAVVPRPNQAYWGICALWSRWLLELPTNHPFLRIIDRKKVDWDWFYDASMNLQNRIRGLIGKGVPVNFVLLEKEPEYTASFLFSMNNAGYKLLAFTLNQSSNTLVMRCQLGNPLNEINAEGIKRAKPEYLAGFVRDLLTQRNEPIPYEYLLVEILCQLSLDASYFFPKKRYKAFIRTLNEVLMNGEFEDIEKRSTPETGTWKVGGSGAQGHLF